MTPVPKSIRYGVSLPTITVAGPVRFGSGRGVPVPSSTTWVEPFSVIAHYSVEPGTCRCNDLGPSITVGLEPCPHLGPDDSGGGGVHDAQSLDNVGNLERGQYLALQQRCDWFGDFSRLQHHVIIFNIEVRIARLGDCWHLRRERRAAGA